MEETRKNRFKRGAGTIAVLALAFSLSGCVTKAGWQYEPGPARLAATRVPLTVAVESFQDQRGTENSRYFVFCALPLLPYCTADYHRPENANGFLTAGAYNFRPSTDLAEATVAELRQTDLFHDVYLTNRTNDPNAQLAIRGSIIDTDWDGELYSYLVGPYAGLMYILGLPLGSVNDALKLNLELVDIPSGRVLWTYEMREDYSKTLGLYYNFGDDFGYAKMFAEGIKPAISSLESYVASRPPGFWRELAAPAGKPAA